MPMTTDAERTARRFGTTELLAAYERAIDENIISSITDARGTILEVNERFCETSQYAADELIGQNHCIVNSGHHPKDFFKSLWGTIGKGNVWRGDIRNRAKDASLYWVDTVIVPIRSDGGGTHYFSLRTLITARKKLEDAKAAQLDSLQALLVMTAMGVNRPLATCLKQIQRFDADAPMDRDELQELMIGLKASVSELSSFTGELSRFVRDMKV